ncbi:MAG: aquaporin [Armatimonadetes bacterium]|nr:aquaporin [Armatimonadota bacterium]
MNFRAYVAEFIGTFALCWVGIYAIHHFAGEPGGLLAIAIAHGLAIGLLATATAPVSGGHLNPAVTLAMMVTRRTGFLDGIVYMVMQVAGGVVAAMAVKSVLGTDVVFAGTPQVTEMIQSIQLSTSAESMRAMTLEAIATFFLVFMVFGSMVDKRAPKVGGMYVGLAVTMGVLAIGPMTGAALNPARWVGPAMVSETPTLQPMVYIAGPVLGGLVAALVYQYVMMGRDQVPGLGEDAAG